MTNNLVSGLVYGVIASVCPIRWNFFLIFGKTDFLWFSIIFLIPDTWYLVSDTWYLDIRTSGHLDIWISGYLDIWTLVTILTPDFCVVHSWQGPFFSRNNTSLKCWTSFKWFLDFLKSKKTRNLTRSWLHQVSARMFDMDLFGGKKVPRHIKRRTALDFGSHVP